MRLTSVHVREFKSIQDSNSFQVGDVTCLVGKNEAGKTAVLEALSRLNPLVEGKKFDVTEDYPRADAEDYQRAVEQKKRLHTTVVNATFTLTKEETQGAREEFGEDVLLTSNVRLSRGYDQKLHVGLDTDEHAAIRHLLNKVELPKSAKEQAAEQKTFKELSVFLADLSIQQQAAFTNAQKQAAVLQDAQEKATATDEANKLTESESAKQLRAKLAQLDKKHLIMHIWDTYLEKHFPKFLYFDEYYQMEGQLNIPKLKERQANKKLLDSDHPMLALIELARLNIDQLLAPQNTQALITKLDSASVHLSKQIFKYWSQNKNLTIRFDIRPALPGDPEGMKEGMNLWGWVYDSAHQAQVRLGTRSRGFIWFFSFLAWFSQQRNTGHPLILLLDEPGLFLHASAQGDLLRYIEQELKPHHQVIFTTHSPFMVDPKYFDRVRIIRDKTMEQRDGDEPLAPDQQGTRVLADALEADEGSIFPLQGALAYDITQTLFVGPNSLLVEGVSDIFYLETMTGVLERAAREGLSDKWTFSPVGGADKVSSFVALFRGQRNLKVAVLIDLQKKDQQKIENIFKAKLLKRNHVLTFADFTKTAEADIEDMFDVPFYLELVNSEFKSELKAPITEANLTSKSPRILVRIEQYLEANPLIKGTFNHYRPARYFVENIADLTPKLSPNTLDRFENACKALNALVP